MSAEAMQSWEAEDEAAILDAVLRWVEKEVRPIAQRHDHADSYPHALVEQMKELGLFGATIGAEYGGLALPARIYSRIVSGICAVWMAPTGIFNSHLIAASCIDRKGTREQKLRLLPRLARGELRGGIALTEPNAGTDLQAIRTRAVRDGDDYVLDGAKTWITNSMHGNCLAVLAKTDPDAEPRHKGTSMFFIETKDDNGEIKPGITIRKLEKLGYRGIDSCEVHFDNFRVSTADLIGGDEGHGFLDAVEGLELGRINIAARSVGVAKGALEMALRYSRERESFGKPICKHQAIQLKLADMATRAQAAQLLVEDAADAYDRGERCDMEAGMAKYFASEAAVFCAEQAMRIFGGYSYSKEYEIERYYRDALLMCIGEGTNEMQRVIIARQLVARDEAHSA